MKNWRYKELEALSLNSLGEDENLLNREIETIEELLSIEPDSKCEDSVYAVS